MQLNSTVLVCLLFPIYCKAVPCGKGQHVYHNSEGYGCKDCPEGSYMAYETHTYRMCKTCREADPYLHEIEVAPCNSTADTVIKCQSNFYREEMKDSMMHDGTCRRCSDCRYVNNAKYEVKKCSDFHNTLCCTRATDVAEEDENGKLICSGDETLTTVPQHSLTYSPTSKGEVNYFVGCDPGEYMAFSNPSNQLASCLQCPQGTFMDKEKHMETHCKECSAEEGKILLRRCTPTSDAVFGDVENNGKANSRAAVLGNSMAIVCIAAAITIGIINPK